MVHMDTAEGTEAVPQLLSVPAWDGSRIEYPRGPHLNVSAEGYEATRYFLGQDVLHGPGAAPVGLDDKLGMCELMTLARVLAENPAIPHGEVLLVFRPDEEIGRMEAVESLADTLHARGVTRGYTVDGITPFEVNVANFNASAGHVSVLGSPVDFEGDLLSLRLYGVKSHGATAKAEGYLNATTVFAQVMAELGDRGDLLPIGFESDPLAETNARIDFCVASAEAREDLLASFKRHLEPHVWRGAQLETIRPVDNGYVETDGLQTVARLLNTFLSIEGPTPVLSEDSEGYEGYSNPHFIRREDGAWTLSFRLRDFDPAGLAAREDHVRRAATAVGLPEADVTITRQYINMGPALEAYPELVEWPLKALVPLGKEARQDPIRGGTGVDPFLQRGIPVANLGTGYFAPESEKELTSRQSIASHSLWLVYLVQTVAGS
jgi:di/tripeptidase